MIYQNLRTGEFVEARSVVDAVRSFGLPLRSGRQYVLSVRDRLHLDGGV